MGYAHQTAGSVSVKTLIPDQATLPRVVDTCAQVTRGRTSIPASRFSVFGGADAASLFDLGNARIELVFSAAEQD